VTLGNPGRAAPGFSAPRRTAPVVRISLSALEVNLRAVLSSSRGSLIDLRADAWGHGARAVAPMALEEGASAMLVDERTAEAVAGILDPALLATVGEGTAPEAVYGLSAGFTPVMSLRGSVLSTKVLRDGEGVSYGYTHRAARDTTVALVTGGYAQGVVRSLGNSASVLIRGERHPIIGRVAMDVCVVDVGSTADLTPGAEVVFFGDASSGAPSLDEWVAASGMTPAELVTAVGLRNAREYTR